MTGKELIDMINILIDQGYSDNEIALAVNNKFLEEELQAIKQKITA